MSFLLFPLHGAILIVNLACLVLIIGALVDAVVRPAAGFVAAGKQTKGFWILVLVLGAFITLVGVIAALVYFLDVRPAVRAAGGGTAGHGSSSDGPYGPYRR
jgi:heme/copper-type cytochrome/quinol oxidase subunit 2